MFHLRTSVNRCHLYVKGIRILPTYKHTRIYTVKLLTITLNILYYIILSECSSAYMVCTNSFSNSIMESSMYFKTLALFIVLNNIIKFEITDCLQCINQSMQLKVQDVNKRGWHIKSIFSPRQQYCLIIFMWNLYI
jgi:hypothetical protein